jgi:Na+/proline symporter
LYKRFFNPSATDAQMLLAVRLATIGSGILGVLLAWTSEDVINTLTIFYTLLSVGLFVPIVGGLYVPRTTNRGALLSVVAGLTAMLTVQLASGGAGFGLPRHGAPHVGSGADSEALTSRPRVERTSLTSR